MFFAACLSLSEMWIPLLVLAVNLLFVHGKKGLVFLSFMSKCPSSKLSLHINPNPRVQSKFQRLGYSLLQLNKMAADEPWLCSGYWLSILRISLCAREKKESVRMDSLNYLQKVSMRFFPKPKEYNSIRGRYKCVSNSMSWGICVTHVGCLYWFIGPQSLCDKGVHFI